MVQQSQRTPNKSRRRRRRIQSVSMSSSEEFLMLERYLSKSHSQSDISTIAKPKKDQSSSSGIFTEMTKQYHTENRRRSRKKKREKVSRNTEVKPQNDHQTYTSFADIVKNNQRIRSRVSKDVHELKHSASEGFIGRHAKRNKPPERSNVKHKHREVPRIQVKTANEKNIIYYRYRNYQASQQLNRESSQPNNLSVSSGNRKQSYPPVQSVYLQKQENVETKREPTNNKYLNQLIGVNKEINRHKRSNSDSLLKNLYTESSPRENYFHARSTSNDGNAVHYDAIRSTNNITEPTHRITSNRWPIQQDRMFLPPHRRCKSYTQGDFCSDSSDMFTTGELAISSSSDSLDSDRKQFTLPYIPHDIALCIKPSKKTCTIL